MAGMTEHRLADEAATAHLAHAIAARLRIGDRIALDGPMGAGKTTFVRHLVAALGGDPAQVASPTYTLLHRYEANLPVVHVDACRLHGPGQLDGLGFAEMAEDAVAAVEWADQVLAALEGPRLWRIAIGHDAGGRRATVEEPA
jgi:tRNA threonylcarbamoyladenosine biosynthesis protein TsaE